MPPGSDHDQQPGLLRHIGHAQADALGQVKKIAAVVGQKRGHLGPGMQAPAVLFSDLLRNLA